MYGLADEDELLLLDSSESLSSYADFRFIFCAGLSFPKFLGMIGIYDIADFLCSPMLIGFVKGLFESTVDVFSWGFACYVLVVVRGWM